MDLDGLLASGGGDGLMRGVKLRPGRVYLIGRPLLMATIANAVIAQEISKKSRE